MGRSKSRKWSLANIRSDQDIIYGKNKPAKRQASQGANSKMTFHYALPVVKSYQYMLACFNTLIDYNLYGAILFVDLENMYGNIPCLLSPIGQHGCVHELR